MTTIVLNRSELEIKEKDFLTNYHLEDSILQNSFGLFRASLDDAIIYGGEVLMGIT